MDPIERGYICSKYCWPSISIHCNWMAKATRIQYGYLTRSQAEVLLGQSRSDEAKTPKMLLVLNVKRRIKRALGDSDLYSISE